MGIVHNQLVSGCAECGKEDLATAVTWEKKVSSFGTMSSAQRIELCPSCAVAVGAMLIGDAREAAVAFRQPAFQHPEEAADPSLVTKRLRESEDDLVMD